MVKLKWFTKLSRIAISMVYQSDKWLNWIERREENKERSDSNETTAIYKRRNNMFSVHYHAETWENNGKKSIMNKN
jgi:hypothetical protein